MILLREMTLDDFPQVLAIEQAIFSDAWKEEHYQYELLENPYAKLYVATCDDDIVGYIGYWITFETCQITTVGVKSSMQSRGIGTLLLEFVEKQARSAGCETILLEVRISNETAKRLYRKQGYFDLNVRKAYYADNFEDAQVMAKGIGEYYEIDEYISD
ncbi:MAG: ribosomal protein S18-alanine N-acetyltransferase [Erysipelotrichaceae bacterium]